jgi:hypothetical protein
MHIEILTEDSSGKALLEHLLPKLVGPYGEPHSWRIIKFGGIGHLPKGMHDGDPKKRTLLNKLPAILRGYARTDSVDAVLVILDSDKRDCSAFLTELRDTAAVSGADGKTMFRLAIEETEAWYFGDAAALLLGYPKAKQTIIDRYRQDSVCGTWELLADAIHTGGSVAILKTGWPLPGQIKHEWANRIGPHMNPDANQSPSFGKLRDGLRRLTAQPPASPSPTSQPG